MRRGGGALVAGVTMSLLSACSRTERGKLTHRPDVLNRGNGPDISSLDPHFITGNWEAYVIGDCLLGLTTEGPDGNAIPGAAEHWQTSADGKIWTFHLRDHRWSDGTQVMAEDFVYAWQRILDPKIAAPYAYYLYLVKNARAVNAGTAPASALGIAAKDDRTLVVILNEPAPYLPEWLQHQTTWPVPRHAVIAKGAAWSRPDNFVGNGPYLPVSWVPNDRVVLKKNPLFYETDRTRIATVNYIATQDNQAALKRLLAGELDLQEPFAIGAIDWLRRNMPAALDIRPNLSNAYILFNFLKPKLRDARIREAMNLAYDREVVSAKILKLGDPTAYAFVPPGTVNYPSSASLRFKHTPMRERVEKARALMANAGYGPDNHFRASYLITPNPDVLRSTAVVQAMMRRIFIDLEITSVDGSIFYKTLSSHEFELAPSSWIGDFNDASTFLDLLYTGNGNNYGSYSSPRFDRLYESAKLQSDAAKRGQLMADAEQVALDDFAVIPTRFRQSQNLVEPYVKGWRTKEPNLRNFHRTRWLWIDPSVARS